MVQQLWGKFTANERMASIGAGLSILAFLLGAVTFGGYAFGLSGLVGLIAPVALLAIYYLKYTNSTIQWPAPIATIAFAIGAIEGLGALFGLIMILSWLSFIGFLFTWLVGPILNIIGGAMMAWFTYREWQAAKGAAPAPGTRIATPSAPMAPPAPPAAPPAASEPPSATDQGSTGA